MHWIYEFFRWKGLLLFWPLHVLFFKRKIYYEDRASQGRKLKGGALVISNHFHAFDFMMNVTLFPFRKLGVVIGEMAWHRKFLVFGMKCFGGIKSDRDVMSMRFIDESVEVLEKGGLVQIFPEAHFTENGEMQDFKPSYILIALRADVPIVPVMLDGSYGWRKRSHCIIGKKIYLSDYCTSLNPTREEIQELNRIVQDKAFALKADLDARIAADRTKKHTKKGDLSHV